MPYVIDQTDGGMYEKKRRPAAEWLPQEQARNLREALGGFLDNCLDTLLAERRDAGESDPYP